MTTLHNAARAVQHSLVVWSVLCHVSRVHAYQNPERFAITVDQGGGGGRYFTGGPLDAYTCSVCHAPAGPTAVKVLGLPDSEYEPGATYRVIIDWPDELTNVALNMEMSDLAGRPLGQWIAPDATTLPPPDHCSHPLSDTPTGTQIVLAGNRALVAMSECGQHQLSVDWQAPAWLDSTTGAPPYDAWFSGSLLASNHDGKLSGDHGADFSRLLIVARTPEVPVTDVRVRCQVTQLGAAQHEHGPRAWAMNAWLALVYGCFRRRRRRS